MKTESLNKQSVDPKWYVVDADGQILGRFASKLADRLRGKDKPTFTPHTDGGDFVVVINAEKVAVTGSKYDKKTYYRHSQYPGGLKETTFKEMIDKKPEEVIRLAVKGMLPKNKLGAALFRNLKVYVGDSHKHDGQNPKLINLNDLK